MKTLTTIISIVALSTITTFAQGVSGGIKGGLNFSSLGGDDFDGAKMKTGYHVGGYVNIALAEALSLQPELLYNIMGAKYSESGSDLKLNLNYISIPVMFIYSFGSFNVQAGPQVSFLSGAKLRFEDGGNSVDIDIKDQFKNSDIGLNIGLGANFGKVNAAARYYLGFSNVADDDSADGKNSAIQLSIGFKLFGE